MVQTKLFAHFIGLCITFLYLTLLSCEGQHSPHKAGLEQETHHPTPQQILSYFKEIAFGSEFGKGNKVIKKWKTDIIIAIDGTETAILLAELDKICQEIAPLIAPLKIYRTEQKEKANFIIWLGSAEMYANKYEPRLAQLIKANKGFFVIDSDSFGYIFKGTMYIDLPNLLDEIDAQKHLLREELTQALGLMNDSHRYEKSIFYQGWSETTAYLPIDRELIRLLYKPWVRVGMQQDEFEILYHKMVLEKK